MLVSFCVIAYNEEKALREFYKETNKILHCSKILLHKIIHMKI